MRKIWASQDEDLWVWKSILKNEDRIYGVRKYFWEDVVNVGPEERVSTGSRLDRGYAFEVKIPYVI